MAITDTKQHLALLCSPGLGHLIPVLELGKRLVTVCNFEVTVFVIESQTSPAEAQVLQSAMTPKLCEVIQLPPVDISTLLGPEAALVTRLCVVMREIVPVFRSAVAALKFRPVAIIVDFFGFESLVVAKELGIPGHVFVTTNAWIAALTLYVPTLDKEVQGEYVDQTEPLKIPGCLPVRPEDTVDPMLERTGQQYSEYVRMGLRIRMADGILINTWEALEPTTFAALRDKNYLGRIFNKPLFPVGPLRRNVGVNGSSSPMCDELLGWLDRQPKGSVVYVSFGSGGTLTIEQSHELAWGLELSGQSFIWVVRSTTTKADASFFTTGLDGEEDTKDFPDGFLTRIKNKGRLVPNWAPQVDIISHPSVGLFLTHCGWNSTLESIANGVPMIAWPLYAEQRMNAGLLAEELGIAVRPKILRAKEVVKREEIIKMIRRIMVDEEGNEIRKRVAQLKESGEDALSKGGSSYNALCSLAEKCKKLEKPAG